MKSLNKSIIIFLSLFLAISVVSATQEQVKVQLSEKVDQTTIMNPLKFGNGVGIWADKNENQSFYNLTGFINVSNSNPNGKTISDIYVSFDYTTNITLPIFVSGRNGTFISNNASSNLLILHIPELRSGESSYWMYSINKTSINPPLNFTSNYSDTKVLAGNNLTLSDNIKNVFNNVPYQNGTCIYGINITENTLPVNFSGVFYNFTFLGNVFGSDSSNVTFSNNNQTLNWNALNSSCLNKTQSPSISYGVHTPYNIPKTTNYNMINATLRYSLNETISQLRVIDLTAIAKAKLRFEKKIIGPTDPVLYGSNVTWNVTGYFNTSANITYNLTTYTLWVAQRIGGPAGDPNKIDNDSISNASLINISNPGVLINSSLGWVSNSWLFNYSDVPSPIVWGKANFTISNDGTQLINRSITKNGNDLYIKELYLIIGYWLEINKNITSVGNNTYHIKIDVHNKGNQVTPADSVVTVYDFVPKGFNVTSPFNFSNPSWYSTTNNNYSVNGTYNGTLFQWGILPTNTLNVSFAKGPAKTINTTWSVDYNVTGSGDYNVMDVFITGLDPQQVDGAGSTKSVVVSEVIDRMKSTEGIFAMFASVLLLFGLVL